MSVNILLLIVLLDFTESMFTKHQQSLVRKHLTPGKELFPRGREPKAFSRVHYPTRKFKPANADGEPIHRLVHKAWLMKDMRAR